MAWGEYESDFVNDSLMDDLKMMKKLLAPFGTVQACGTGLQFTVKHTKWLDAWRAIRASNVDRDFAFIPQRGYSSVNGTFTVARWSTLKKKEM